MTRAKVLLLRGFTIVELLIVIVVMGILVAIALTSYRGVQERAAISTLSADLAGVGKKFKSQQAIDGTYPSTYTGSSDGTSFQVTTDNTANPQTYCVTGTLRGVAYYVTESGAAAKPGACAGHSVSGPSVMPFTIGYNFSGSVFTPSTVAADVTASAATAGPGLASLAIFNVGGTYTSIPVLQANSNASATSAPTAISNSSYWYLTLTPGAGRQLKLNSIAFNTARGGGSTPRGFVLRSSIDGYASDLYAGDVTATRPAWMPLTIDLSSLATSSSPVTLRFYVYTPSSVSIEWDDITITGQTTTN